MHLVSVITIAVIFILLRPQNSNCDERTAIGSGVLGGSANYSIGGINYLGNGNANSNGNGIGVGNGNVNVNGNVNGNGKGIGIGIGSVNSNTIAGLPVNSSLLNTLLNGHLNTNGATLSDPVTGSGVTLGGLNPILGNTGIGIGSGSNGGTIAAHDSSIGHGHGGHGHSLAGLASLGMIATGNNGRNGGVMHPGIIVGGGGGGHVVNMNPGPDSSLDRSIGSQNPYYEHLISEHTVMAVFTSQGQVGGPCRYMPATRRQNHQCRKEPGLPNTIREARRLATTHCENQFRYDRWNCSIELHSKRSIFRKLYKETAFVHALTAAAMTHSIARACAEGRLTKCSCGPRKENRKDQDFQWGGCNDNLKHGKRVARSFLDLRGGDGNEITEILRHDSEVGIEAVSTKLTDKCKCHGVSGSCSMKTCWKKLSDFNETATLLRQKYNQAIRKPSNTRTMRREAPPTSRMRKPKQRRKKHHSQYTTLYYLEPSPSYCFATKERQCLHKDNCANLCCGRGYVTHVFKEVEKCRCRFNNDRCCQLICDYCQRYEERYFCK